MNNIWNKGLRNKTKACVRQTFAVRSSNPTPNVLRFQTNSLNFFAVESTIFFLGTWKDSPEVLTNVPNALYLSIIFRSMGMRMARNDWCLVRVSNIRSISPTISIGFTKVTRFFRFVDTSEGGVESEFILLSTPQKIDLNWNSANQTVPSWWHFDSKLGHSAWNSLYHTVQE